MVLYARGTEIGPFRLERELSDGGGMAVVYEASLIDTQIPEQRGKRVALKIQRMTSQFDKFETMLKRETDWLNKLRHPGIVRLYHIAYLGRIVPYGRARKLDSNPFYFAMELLSQHSVQSLLTSGAIRKYNLAWKLELIYHITTSIAYMHLWECAHRDLKPDNILFRVAPNPKDVPSPVLIDFGLTEKREIQPEINAATLTHAAPERVDEFMSSPHNYRRTGESIDHFSADIWALGVISYEILSNGLYPFGEYRQRSELAQRIREGRVPPLEAVPNVVQELVMAMLNKNPKGRPTANRVIQALETEIELVPPRI